MRTKQSRIRTIGAIVRKDLALYSRDLLFVFLSILSIVTFVVLYWVLPRDVDETISMGVRGSEMRVAMTEFAEEEDEGLALVWYETESELRAAVEEREIEIGLNFPDGFIADVASGKGTTVTVIARPNLPEEITGAMGSMVREIAYAVAGYELPVTEPDEEFVVVGQDMAGDQVPFRDRLKPLYAFIVLMLEAIALAALVSSEIQQRTVTAILSTPARIWDILLAKGTLGTLVAFTETALILLLIGAYGPSPLLVLVTVLLGAVMVTSVAMIAGSAGRDLISTMLLGIVLLIPLGIPGFSVLFPGSPAPWIEYLPSYGIVRIIFDATTAGSGWSEAARHLGVLAAWCAGLGLVGSLILKRRVETL